MIESERESEQVMFFKDAQSLTVRDHELVMDQLRRRMESHQGEILQIALERIGQKFDKYGPEAWNHHGDVELLQWDIDEALADALAYQVMMNNQDHTRSGRGDT